MAKLTKKETAEMVASILRGDKHGANETGWLRPAFRFEWSGGSGYRYIRIPQMHNRLSAYREFDKQGIPCWVGINRIGTTYGPVVHLSYYAQAIQLLHDKGIKLNKRCIAKEEAK